MGRERADGGPARITQSEQLGTFIEGFAGRIVDRVPQHVLVAQTVDAHDLGVTAANQ